MLFHNVETGEKKSLRSPAGSIGALAVHHEHKYFAVAGKGKNKTSRILVYFEFTYNNELIADSII